MKKRGSIIIESVVGIIIILSMFLIVSSLIVENIKTSFRREAIEKSNRIIYCIMQEIKYNMTLQEILNLTENQDFKLKNYEEFLSDLSTIPLNTMPKGNEIIIKTIKTEDIDKIEVEINLKLNQNEDLKRTFTKYKWMEYYEEM